MDSNERAYELLKWQALAPLSEFDETYSYAKVWQEHSDAALDAWDKQHPYETSAELAAFRELERLGVFTQSDFYSSTKASDGYYGRRLAEFKAGTRDKADPVGSPRGEAGARRKGTRLDGRHARHGNRTRNRRRHSRQ